MHSREPRRAIAAFMKAANRTRSPDVTDFGRRFMSRVLNAGSGNPVASGQKRQQPPRTAVPHDEPTKPQAVRRPKAGDVVTTSPIRGSILQINAASIRGCAPRSRSARDEGRHARNRCGGSLRCPGARDCADPKSIAFGLTSDFITETAPAMAGEVIIDRLFSDV
jgi:hypothetical protein